MSDTQPLPPFQLDDELRTELSGLDAAASAQQGGFLFRRGDAPKGAFLLVRGRVALSADEAGAQLRRNCLPGCLLGLPATLRDKPYSLTAECLEDCEVVRVSHDALISLLARNQRFCMRVVEILANEVGELRSRMPEHVSRVARMVEPVHAEWGNA